MNEMKHLETGEILSVYRLIMTFNLWEYYILEDFGNDLVKALVLGYETEIGDVSLEEITPFILTDTRDLTQVLPATGYRWI